MQTRDAPPATGGYTLHLYCRYTVDLEHDHDTWGVEFYGNNQRSAYAAARAKGWKIDQSGMCTCPACARRKRPALRVGPDGSVTHVDK